MREIKENSNMEYLLDKEIENISLDEWEYILKKIFGKPTTKIYNIE